MNRWWPVMRALLGHWRRHPVQFATLIVGLAVATALWSGVQALNAEARASYDRAAAVVGGGAVASIISIDGGRFGIADYLALRREGWPVSPILEGTWRREGGSLRVVGVEPVTLPEEAEGLVVDPDASRAVEFLTPPWLGFVAPETLAELEGAPDLPPLAEDASLPPDTLVVDIALAEILLGAEGRISRLILPPEWDRPLPGALAAHLRLAGAEEEPELARLTDSFHLNLTAFGFLAFVVGLFIVYSATGLAFEERRATFRTLRACGVPAAGLAMALVGETLALALPAGAAGIGAGYAVAAALLPDVAASLRGLYGAQVPGSLGLEPAWWLAGLGVSVAGALAASATSLWRAWTLPVLAPAQPEAWRAATARSLRRQVALAAFALAVALLAWTFGETLEAGFMLMGGLLLGAALLLPALIATMLRLGAGSARGPVSEWLWADARQGLGALSLALMALLLALAVNVGVGTMVESFRLTFTGYLDQRLAPELYVTARDEAEAREVAEWLGTRPEVESVLPLPRASTRMGGWPVEVYGFRDDRTYRESWPLLAAMPEAWDAVAEGKAVMISEQLARRLGIAPGDPVELPVPGGIWRPVAAGIYPDYGNPEGQIMVAEPAVHEHWDEVTLRQIAARAEPADVPSLLHAIETRFGLGEGQAVDQARVKAGSQEIFERTFAVTVALNALTLTVAGIALFTNLLALSGARLVQVAPLWAIGVPRRLLARLELARALVLAGFTAVLALPLGLLVAVVLTDVVNVRAFGWRLPVHFFPRDWALLFAMALATAFAAALLPALRLRRAEPADLIRGFSNER